MGLGPMLGLGLRSGLGSGSWGSNSVGLGPGAELRSIPDTPVHRIGAHCSDMRAADHNSAPGPRSMLSLPHNPDPNPGPSPDISPGPTHLPTPLFDITPCLPGTPMTSAQPSLPCLCRSWASLHGDPAHPLCPMPPAVGVGQKSPGAQAVGPSLEAVVTVSSTWKELLLQGLLESESSCCTSPDLLVHLGPGLPAMTKRGGAKSLRRLDKICQDRSSQLAVFFFPPLG